MKLLFHRPIRTIVIGALDILLVTGSLGCFRQDIRSLKINVPNMKSAECAKIIQSALNRVEGIVSVEPDVETRVLTVSYNSTKVAIKNIEYVIVGLGFDANDEVGKSDAKSMLPSDCR